MSDEQVSELRYIEELEAEVEKLREEPNVVQYGQLERERDETRKQRDRYRERAEEAEAKLAEVEAENIALTEGIWPGTPSPASIKRAREIAEAVTKCANRPHTWSGEVARLLSGKAE